MASLAESYVTALLVRTSFYGLYMITLVVCLRWLLLTEEGGKLRRLVAFDWPVIGATVFIFASYTTWLGIHCQLTMESVRGVEFNFYHTYALGAVTITTAIAIFLVTDAFMIYRCWKVYNKSWRIIVLPVLSWIGCLISVILSSYYNHQMVVALDEMWILKADQARIVFYPFNAATNIYTTAAIIYRVMRDASKKGSGHSLKRLRRLCRNLAETGTLYTLTTIPPLVGYILNDLNLQGDYLTAILVSEAVNVSMAGITFNLVLIRVSQSRADAAGSQLDFQTMDRRGLFSGRHHHNASSSTQDLLLATLKKGSLQKQVPPGLDQVIIH